MEITSTSSMRTNHQDVVDRATAPSESSWRHHSDLLDLHRPRGMLHVADQAYTARLGVDQAAAVRHPRSAREGERADEDMSHGPPPQLWGGDEREEGCLPRCASGGRSGRLGGGRRRPGRPAPLLSSCLDCDWLATGTRAGVFCACVWGCWLSVRRAG